MKRFEHLRTFLIYGIIAGLFLIASCTDENTDVKPKPTSPKDADSIVVVAEIGKIIESLKFDNAIIKDGDPPNDPMLADLKIDREIIHLSEKIKNRIRMLLPKDFKEDICGVYIKVVGSENYFDVKSVNMDSDSLAFFYIGFDPEDLQPPLNFQIEIIPYNCLGIPLDIFEKEIVVDINDGCTPHSPGAKWYWVSTTIDGELAYAPGFTINSVTGSTKGCCMEGFSVDCISNGIPEEEWKPMSYASFVEYPLEYLVFLEDGTFNGGLWENKQNLDYSESNFCNNSPAYINSLNENLFWGEYNFDISNSTIDLTKLEVREEEIYLEAIDLVVIEYDVCFLSTSAEYEMIGCNFIVERTNREGQVRERLFERWSGGWEWFD